MKISSLLFMAFAAIWAFSAVTANDDNASSAVVDLLAEKCCGQQPPSTSHEVRSMVLGGDHTID